VARLPDLDFSIFLSTDEFPRVAIFLSPLSSTPQESSEFIQLLLQWWFCALADVLVLPAFPTGGCGAN